MVEIIALLHQEVSYRGVCCKSVPLYATLVMCISGLKMDWNFKCVPDATSPIGILCTHTPNGDVCTYVPSYPHSQAVPSRQWSSAHSKLTLVPVCPQWRGFTVFPVVFCTFQVVFCPNVSPVERFYCTPSGFLPVPS